MKVSFIVPVYNVEQYIEDCVRSIMGQSYKDIQIILVDDGSTDDSYKRCLELQEEDGRIEIIRLEHQGVSAARNKGISHAEGDWIAFVDADDTISGNYVEIFAGYLELDYDICCGEEQRKGNKGNGNIQVLNRDIFFIYEKGLLNKYAAGQAPHLTSACSKLYRKSFLDKYGIAFPHCLRKSEDAMFNQYAFHFAQKGVYINTEIYYYRKRGRSASNKYDRGSVENYRKHLGLIRIFMQKEGIYDKVEADYWVRSVFHFFYCAATDFCHRDNPYKYGDRKVRFIKARNTEPFAKAFRYGKCRGFSMKEKVLFYCIKYRIFSLTEIIFMVGRLVGAVR